jgi:DNA-binding NtrC family response regulator
VNEILLIGTDASLLEGLSQTVAAVGQAPVVAGSVADGARLAALAPPLLVVIDRDLAAADGDILRVPLARGGALILYRTVDPPAPILSAALRRAVLADLLLPLERARLVALLHTVIERARRTGGHRAMPAPEVRREP